MVLSKMNNHEHRTKQTYESYTFQPLMSFWYYREYKIDNSWPSLRRKQLEPALVSLEEVSRPRSQAYFYFLREKALETRLKVFALWRVRENDLRKRLILSVRWIEITA